MTRPCRRCRKPVMARRQSPPEALQVAARHVDVYLAWGEPPDMVRERLDRMRALAASGHATATDLADWLVRELNLPFRKAHHVTGAAVKRAEALNVDLSHLPLAELQSLEAGVTEAVYKVLTPEASCASRQSFGGTAPEQVRARIAEWKTRLA